MSGSSSRIPSSFLSCRTRASRRQDNKSPNPDPLRQNALIERLDASIENDLPVPHDGDPRSDPASNREPLFDQQNSPSMLAKITQTPRDKRDNLLCKPFGRFIDDQKIRPATTPAITVIVDAYAE